MANEYVTQANYGGSAGWEDLTFDETLREAEQSLADYESNDPGIARRIVERPKLTKIATGQFGGIYVASAVAHQLDRNKCPECGIQLRADGSPDVLPGESGHYAGCTR